MNCFERNYGERSGWYWSPTYWIWPRPSQEKGPGNEVGTDMKLPKDSNVQLHLMWTCQKCHHFLTILLISFAKRE